MTESLDSESGLTDSQERILASLSLLSGSLSLLASFAIIFMTLRSSLKSPYKRIMLGLSVSDIIASFSHALIAFLLPAATSPRVWAKGTPATCSFGGFLVQLSFSTFWYNGFLSFYYLATIRFGVSHANFAKRWEPWVHILSIGWNLGSASLGLVFDIYEESELGQLCWIGDVPKGCSLDENETCIGPSIGWGTAGVWAAFFFMAVIVNNLIIYRYVRRTLARSKNNSLHGSSAFEQRLKAVATQGFLYVGSFLLTYSWFFAVRLMASSGLEASNEGRFFVLYVFQAVFLPLQGCFNVFIYVRPAYLQCRREHPEESIAWALKRVLCGQSIAPTLDCLQTSVRGSRAVLVARAISSGSTNNDKLAALPVLPTNGPTAGTSYSESGRSNSTDPTTSSRLSCTQQNLNISCSEWSQDGIGQLIDRNNGDEYNNVSCHEKQDSSPDGANLAITLGSKSSGRGVQMDDKMDTMSLSESGFSNSAQTNFNTSQSQWISKVDQES